MKVYMLYMYTILTLLSLKKSHRVSTASGLGSQLFDKHHRVFLDDIVEQSEVLLNNSLGLQHTWKELKQSYTCIKTEIHLHKQRKICIYVYECIEPVNVRYLYV